MCFSDFYPINIEENRCYSNLFLILFISLLKILKLDVILYELCISASIIVITLARYGFESKFTLTPS